MRQPEKHRDNDSRPTYGRRDISLHSGRHLGHKRGPSCVAHFHRAGSGLHPACGSINDRLYRIQPLLAFPIIPQRNVRFDEDDSERAVRGAESLLAFGERWRRARNTLRQARQTEWIIAEPRNFLRREGGCQLFTCRSQRFGECGRSKTIGEST